MELCITKGFLKELSVHARHVPRIRLNHNWHDSYEDPVQRLCNAIEPESYIRPHEHAGKDRWEIFLIIKGAADVLIFEHTGALKNRIELREGGPCYGIEIPGGSFHTLVARKKGTVLFEVKPGPFVEETDKIFADWSPQEGEDVAKLFVTWFKKAKIGEVPPALSKP